MVRSRGSSSLRKTHQPAHFLAHFPSLRIKLLHKSPVVSHGLRSGRCNRSWCVGEGPRQRPVDGRITLATLHSHIAFSHGLRKPTPTHLDASPKQDSPLGK